jgi:hypothetical protein
VHVAYLSSNVTLPRSPHRRPDAFEHDQTMDCLRAAFAPHGDRVTDLAWDDPTVAWERFDAALIGTTWDYQGRLDEFLGALARIASATRLYNPLDLATWSCHKRYLRDLEARGVPIVPTVFCDGPDAPAAARDVLDRHGAGAVVIKRQVGAGAVGQRLAHRGDPVADPGVDVMIQPFQDTIRTEGELSFVFVDGELSHALVKRAAPGDYRVQAGYGGSQTRLDPAAADLAAAAGVLAAVDERPLYARVDMVRDHRGALRLMELELVEPFLYPLEGSALGERLHRALARRIGAS